MIGVTVYRLVQCLAVRDCEVMLANGRTQMLPRGRGGYFAEALNGEVIKSGALRVVPQRVDPKGVTYR
jgi:hypothetical protein